MIATSFQTKHQHRITFTVMSWLSNELCLSVSPQQSSTQKRASATKRRVQAFLSHISHTHPIFPKDQHQHQAFFPEKKHEQTKLQFLTGNKLLTAVSHSLLSWPSPTPTHPIALDWTLDPGRPTPAVQISNWIWEIAQFYSRRQAEMDPTREMRGRTYIDK